MVNLNWNRSKVSLSFQISDKTLFTKTLTMDAREVKLNPGFKVVELPGPPPEILDSGCQGYLVRSIPVAQRQKWIRFSGKYICYVPSQYQRYFIDLNITYDDYLKKFSSKTRSTIRRKVKKFAKQCGGEIVWKRYTSREEMKEFYKGAREVSKHTYQEKLLDAGLPEGDEFIQKLDALAANDSVRGYLMFDGKKPIAYLYCPVEEEMLIYQYLGYDPTYRSWSIGTILHWYALEDILQEGKHKFFDFTEGESEHKRLYSTGSVLCANVYFFPKKMGYLLLVSTHRGMSVFTEKIGDLLERVGIKAKIRRLIRFGK